MDRILELLNGLQENQTNTVWAAPSATGESLADHVGYMVTAFKNFFPSPPSLSLLLPETTPKSLKRQLPILIPLLTILLHDIGKLNPFFQARMNGVEGGILLYECSYHSSNSALIALFVIYLLVQEWVKDNQINLSEGDALQVRRVCWFLIYNAIMNHHHRRLYVPRLSSENCDKNLFSYFVTNLSQVYPCIFPEFQHFIENLFPALTQFLESLFQASSWISRLMQNCNKYFATFTKKFNNPLTQLQELGCDTGEKQQFLFFYQQYLASVLIDLDVWAAKTHRDTTPENRFSFDEEMRRISPNIVSTRQDALSNEQEDKDTINPIRARFSSHVRDLVNQLALNPAPNQGLFLKMIAPTGTGKTLNLLYSALELREKYACSSRSSRRKRIIYALPFVSIAEQLQKVMLELFKSVPGFDLQTPWLTVHNYLAPLVGNDENPGENLSDDDENIPASSHFKSWFEIKNWRSNIVITTTIRLFETLLRPFKENVMRFHRLTNSIIIIDEYHTLPVHYFQLLRKTMNVLSKYFGVDFLLATATSPAMFTPETTSTPPIELATHTLFSNAIEELERAQPGVNFSNCLNRYEVQIRAEKIPFEAFLDEVKKILETLVVRKHQHLMIVVNTKDIARETYRHLLDWAEDRAFSDELIVKHLSGNLEPYIRRDRIKAIRRHLKNEKKPLLLVTTQLIEAGVDISFNNIIRDMGPVSSIVQVAGRCNRGANSPMGRIFVFHIQRDDHPNQSWAQLVYGGLAIDITLKFFNLMPRDIPIAEAVLREHYTEYSKLVNDAVLQDFRLEDGSLLSKKIPRLEYQEISSNFHLIDQDYGTILLVIIPETSPKREEVLASLSRLFKWGGLPRRLYLNTISIPNREARSIADLASNLEPEIIENLKMGHPALFYTYSSDRAESLILFLDLKHPEASSWYQPETGYEFSDQ